MENREREEREEEARLHRAKVIVDSACYHLRRNVQSPHAAVDLIIETKARILDLFPDKASQFDLIYLPRFVRLMRKRWGNNISQRHHSERALL